MLVLNVNLRFKLHVLFFWKNPNTMNLFKIIHVFNRSLDISVKAKVWNFIFSLRFGLSSWDPFVLQSFLSSSSVLERCLDFLVLSKVWHEIVDWMTLWSLGFPSQERFSIDFSC